MAVSKAIQDDVRHRLERFVPVTMRSMFGGVGIYSEGIIFALILSDGRLQFKVDETNRSDYEGAGMPRFENMPYYQVPDEVLDDPETLRLWIERAFDVARRSKKGKKKR